jgi:hypothetical protein
MNFLPADARYYSSLQMSRDKNLNEWIHDRKNSRNSSEPGDHEQKGPWGRVGSRLDILRPYHLCSKKGFSLAALGTH